MFRRDVNKGSRGESIKGAETGASEAEEQKERERELSLLNVNVLRLVTSCAVTCMAACLSLSPALSSFCIGGHRSLLQLPAQP